MQELPEVRQNEAAELLMHYAEDEGTLPTADQRVGIRNALDPMDRGEFASEHDMTAMRRRHSLLIIRYSRIALAELDLIYTQIELDNSAPADDVKCG